MVTKWRYNEGGIRRVFEDCDGIWECKEVSLCFEGWWRKKERDQLYSLVRGVMKYDVGERKRNAGAKSKSQSQSR